MAGDTTKTGQPSEDVAQLQEQLTQTVSNSPADEAVALAAASRLHLLEAVLEAVPVGILVADKDGKIIHGNARVEEIVGHTVIFSDDADAYSEWEAYHEDGRRVESHEFPLARALNNEEAPTLDVHYARGDGTRIWVRLIGHIVRDENNSIIGASVALVDIDNERRMQREQEILIGELNHRVKNAFSVVKSIVSRSLQGEKLPDGLRDTINARLMAYAEAHSKLVGNEWDRAPIHLIAQDVLGAIRDGRIEFGGPEIFISSRNALALSMAFYELMTNATKHGALSTEGGKIALSWFVEKNQDENTIKIKWKETGGPAVDSPPDSKGFGSFIIDRALTMETNGEVSVEYPNDGFEWRLKMPV